MGWSIGYSNEWKRDIGYGVPAYCDHLGCMAEIDRGLGYACCGGLGDKGCGRFYCSEHQSHGDRCKHKRSQYVSPDHPIWVLHKLTDPSWAEWRERNPGAVKPMRETTAGAYAFMLDNAEEPE